MYFLSIVKCVLVSALLATVTCKDDVVYNVIAYPGPNYKVAVNVDGKTYPLSESKDANILFTGKAPQGNYHYVILDKQYSEVVREAFARPQVNTQTPNQFFNISWTKKDPVQLPTLLQPLSPVNRIKTKLHPTGEIPTIHITGNQAQLDALSRNRTSDDVLDVQFTYIESDKVQQFKKASFSLEGRSSRWVDKMSYELDLPDGGNGLYGLHRMKLRAMRTDPSYIRERLIYDMSDSLGIPVSGAHYVRLIVNDRPIGLFLMIEAFKGDWLDVEFNNGKPMKNGALFKAAGFVTDLKPLANLSDYQKFYTVAISPASGNADYGKLEKLTTFFANPPTGDHAELLWNKVIGIENFIRSMVVEIAGGFSDGFIATVDNYFLYDDLKHHKFIYVPADFDLTLGNTLFNISKQWSGNYQDYPGFSVRSPTVNMMKVPILKARFEYILNQTVTQMVDLPHIQARIKALVDMLSEDVAWDTALPKVTSLLQVGKNFTGLPTGLSGVDMGSLTVPVDNATVRDGTNNSRFTMPFHTAVMGPTGHISLTGVYEWFMHLVPSTARFLATKSS
ncbi:hypothetical protein DM01DRAFT_1307194 [Hesseltinella vesiculosa]|uniref:Coth-domain-containing protein n=1 Tax=Hesseltinella vesiculosa TaxID=101127 RepID=A0A1X2GEQ7_9FUNG|nr:hypothetical protein DM01DRAFT_1307194 [Hesseltinella vesiculosa]